MGMHRRTKPPLFNRRVVVILAVLAALNAVIWTAGFLRG